MSVLFHGLCSSSKGRSPLLFPLLCEVHEMDKCCPVQDLLKKAQKTRDFYFRLSILFQKAKDGQRKILLVRATQRLVARTENTVPCAGMTRDGMTAWGVASWSSGDHQHDVVKRGVWVNPQKQNPGERMSSGRVSNPPRRFSLCNTVTMKTMHQDMLRGNGPSIQDITLRLALLIAWNNIPTFKRASKAFLFNIILAIFASVKMQEKINNRHTA